MRVAIGSFSTETHSFSKDLTPLEAFQACIWEDAEHMVDAQRGNRGDGGGANVGGFIDYAEAHDWEIAPLFCAGAWPSGPIPAHDYETIKKQFRPGLENLDVDGVLLHLHGAAVVEGLDDAEGDFLTFVREMVGEEVPVLVLLDLHANVSDLMCEKADAIYGYDQYPHLDIYERQQEICQLLEKMVAGEAKPFTFRTQPPLLFPAILTTTDTEHMKKIRARAEEWEKQDGVINVATFAGYYASDKYEAGPSTVVVTNDDPDLAVKVSKDISDLFWELKNEFLFPMTPINEAIEEAKNTDGTYGFMDECDDPLGGGASDGTYILQALLDAGIESGGVSVIRDPEIVAKAWETGVGGTVSGKLGAKIDNMHGTPIDINATVLKLSDQKIPVFYDDPTTLQSVGRMAVIEERGFKIVVVELKGGFEGIDIFGILGYNIEDMKAVVLKGSSGAYKNVFRDRISKYTIVESLGITSPDVTRIGDFKNLRRPIWPLDENVTMRYK